MANIAMTQHLQSAMPPRPWVSSISSRDQTGIAIEPLNDQYSRLSLNSQQDQSQTITNNVTGSKWENDGSSTRLLGLREVMAANSLPESHNLRELNGTAIGSNKEHLSSKLSISDFIHVVKTDPEVKRLLVDALTRDKSFAPNVTSDGPSTILPGECSSSSA
jgi:hypothetical protein